MRNATTLIQEEGIGSTINRFEQLAEQNIETFNTMFPYCKLTGFNPSFSVTIGEYNKGLREVTVNDTIVLAHEFSHIDFTLGHRIVLKFILSYPDGETIGKFNSMNEAAKQLDCNTTTLRSHILKGKYRFEELKNE